MKRMRIIGLCLTAVFATSALMVTSASAFVRSAPEFGRCVKTAGGKWKDGGCKTPAKPGEEKFEWQPAFEPGNKYNEAHPLKLAYKSVNKPLTPIQLETVGNNPGKVKSVVKCTGQKSEGLVTGAKTRVTTHAVFTGCETSGLKCKSSNKAEGEIAINDQDSVLGVYKLGETAAKNKIAYEFTPKTGFGGQITVFSCGGLAVEVRGHVLVPATANAMKLTATVKFVEKAGKQNPERFVGGEKLILESKFSNIPGAAFEQSGQTLTAIETNEEKLEISTLE